MRTRTKLAIGVAVILIAAGFGLFAYRALFPPPPAPSQRASVMQQVANATITIDYSRPVARGRELFGSLVPYGKPWCPGADKATKITVSRSIQVNGQSLDKGSYSIWAIPESDSWTIIFSRKADVWHEPYPQGEDAVRVTASPRQGPHMETLAYYFPVVDGRGAELDLHWGRVVVPLQITVP
jgi:hypothetical protein